MNEKSLKTVDESVYDAVLDILRELEREEASKLFRLLVGRLTSDIETGISALLRQRVRAVSPE